MATKGRKSKSYQPSSMTHRVAKTFANRIGKKVIQLQDRDRVSVPAALVGQHWHIVATAPLQEKRAHEWLKEHGAIVYTPMQVRWTHHAREKKAVERALFPGYTFLTIATNTSVPGDREERQRAGIRHIDWLGMMSAKHLGGFLGQVYARQLDGEFDEPGTTSRAASDEAAAYEIGQKIEILQGAFASVLGDVTSVTASHVTLETKLFGRATPIRIPIEETRPIG